MEVKEEDLFCRLYCFSSFIAAN